MTAGEHSDVVVVGAGIIGMSAAWNLGRRGAKVLVAERTGVGSGATAVQPGGVRTQWTSPDTCAMALEARQFYDRIDEVLQPDPGPDFDPCGYAFVASSPSALPQMADNVRRQNELGVPSVMLSPAELGALVPGLDTDQVAGGSYNAQDGYFGRPGSRRDCFRGCGQPGRSYRPPCSRAAAGAAAGILDPLLPRWQQAYR